MIVLNFLSFHIYLKNYYIWMIDDIKKEVMEIEKE
jgi:hypothetical protein